MKSLIKMDKISSLVNQNSFSISSINIPCEICGKQSNFTCFKCQSANYCSKEHQEQDWKTKHKTNCMKKKVKINDKNEELKKQILEARKNYYENYGNKIFTHCLLDVKLMTGLSYKLMISEPENIQYQLEYGASVCLLVRTHKMINDLTSAKHIMQDYLKSHKKFLYDINPYNEVMNNTSLTEEIKEQLQMKLNLISGIANLCYVIGLNATEYYVLYTKFIISCFGQESFQASNCYFLIGCFFAEEGWFNKAIACFEKSAKIRGQFAGDCMYNIGVLYKLLNNLPKALQTLQIALKLRQEQYGQDSNQVAQVNELMGNIYTELNDYKTALMQYEKAFKVRSTNPYTPEFQNVLDLIHELYDKLCLYIKIGQPNMKRPQIYTHLKQQIQGETTYWQNEKYKRHKKQEQESGDKQEKENVEKYKKKRVTTTDPEKKNFSWKQSGLFNITEEFVATLNLSQLYRLSQLQLELEACESLFNLAYIIGTSVFFQSLRPQKKTELETENKKLFELMRMQDIIKIKHKDK